jgi:hypothetical protein
MLILITDRDAATRELEAEDLEIHIKNFIASSEDERERFLSYPTDVWGYTDDRV